VVRGRDGLNGIRRAGCRRQVRDVVVRVLWWRRRAFKGLMRAGERGIIVPNSRQEFKEKKNMVLRLDLGIYGYTNRGKKGLRSRTTTEKGT
jgi:hypothetical protein